MRVWALKTCDTCRKAVKSLKAQFGDVEVIDVRADGVNETDLGRFISDFGDAVINRKSATWRGLSEADRNQAPVALLLAQPTVMKRPVIEADDGTLYLGWTSETQRALGF